MFLPAHFCLIWQGFFLNSFMQRIALLLFLTILSGSVMAQTATGSWYGRADVSSGNNYNNYLVELILKQKGDEVEGIFGYYFKDSYQSFFVRGTYDKQAREVHIKNLPLIHNRAESRNGIECPMNFIGTLLVSQVKSTLNGYFYSDDKYKYTCPELRVVMQIDARETNQDSVLRNTVAGKKFWQPLEEDYVVSNTGTKPAVVQEGEKTAGAPMPDLAKKEADTKLLQQQFDKRQNTYSKDIEVESDSIRISFYDNGDVDGDSISVFVDKVPVMTRQTISTRALNLYLILDSSKSVHELSMLAENLGKYPPNTALMVITDGINRYEVYLSSTLTQNASVRLRKKPRK